jgi:hypothetical protein
VIIKETWWHNSRRTLCTVIAIPYWEIPRLTDLFFLRKTISFSHFKVLIKGNCQVQMLSQENYQNVAFPETDFHRFPSCVHR